MGFFRREKSLAEIEEETERLEAESKKASLEFSVAEKRAMAERLRKEYGLTPKHFGLDWKRIWQWIKTH